MNGVTEEHTPVERIVETVSGWPGVNLAPHSYDGVEFRLDDYEFGHVHHGWRSLHVNYPRQIRDALIAAGRAERHPYFSDSGWTNYPVETTADVAHARWLLRLSYLYRASILRENPAAQTVRDEVDIVAALAKLDPDEDVRVVVEDVLGRQA